MTQKVAAVHGGEDARLHQVRETFLGLVAEMTSRMMKEVRILFPMVRQLEASPTARAFHSGSLANPIRVMEMEHDHDQKGKRKAIAAVVIAAMMSLVILGLMVYGITHPST